MVRRDRGRRCGRASPSNDAEAICEAVTRPTMRFVPVKSAERQAALLDHKTREFLVPQRTQLVTPEACLRHDTIRAHLSEFGPCGPRLGRNAPPERFVRGKPAPLAERRGQGHPQPRSPARGGQGPARGRAAGGRHARRAAARHAGKDRRGEAGTRAVRWTDRPPNARIEAAPKTDPLAKRLATIPGVEALSASAIAASCQRHASGVTPEVDNFRSARDLFAGETVPRTVSSSRSPWLGLTPQPHSSGSKERLGRISKAGNRYLRRLLYLGAMMSQWSANCPSDIGE